MQAQLIDPCEPEWLQEHLGRVVHRFFDDQPYEDVRLLCLEEVWRVIEQHSPLFHEELLDVLVPVLAQAQAHASLPTAVHEALLRLLGRLAARATGPHFTRLVDALAAVAAGSDGGGDDGAQQEQRRAAACVALTQVLRHKWSTPFPQHMLQVFNALLVATKSPFRTVRLEALSTLLRISCSPRMRLSLDVGLSIFLFSLYRYDPGNSHSFFLSLRRTPKTLSLSLSVFLETAALLVSCDFLSRFFSLILSLWVQNSSPTCTRM